MLLPRTTKGYRSGEGRSGARKGSASASGKSKPSLASFIDKRDYTGALTLLEFELGTEDEPDDCLLWLAYSAFHAGEFQRAADAYSRLIDQGGVSQSSRRVSSAESKASEGKAGEPARGAAPVSVPMLHLFRAACLYYMQEYDGAFEDALRGPEGNSLRTRLLFHIAQRRGDETTLMKHHAELSAHKRDQLSLAAMHYFRHHFQEATDIYKRLLLENRDDAALNVYVAMCYYKLDYYDVSLEILNVYLQQFPGSVVALNLKAANHYRLFNGTSAETELKALVEQGVNINDHPLLQHNLVVFRDGHDAVRVLPRLVGMIPEAKLNLVIYYLRAGEDEEAFEAMRTVEPSTPAEYILKAIVHANIGQKTNSREKMQTAQDLFQVVGASASECDTIPGRQCMASCFYLLRQFDDVNLYLTSIKAYMYNEDAFNWNYGIAQAVVGQYKEGLEGLLQVQKESYRRSYTYLAWLARCYIRTGQPGPAWDLYLKMDTSKEAFQLLKLIADDCYTMGFFYFASRAFNILGRLDPDTVWLRAKQGAVIGVFQQLIASRQGRLPAGQPRATEQELAEALSTLQGASNPQVEYTVRVIRKWCADNGIPL